MVTLQEKGKTYCLRRDSYRGATPMQVKWIKLDLELYLQVRPQRQFHTSYTNERIKRNNLDTAVITPTRELRGNWDCLSMYSYEMIILFQNFYHLA